MAAVVRVPVESSLGTLSVNVWHYRITNASPLTEINEILVKLDTFYTALATWLRSQTFTIGARVVSEDQTNNFIVIPTVQTASMSGTGGEVLSACAVLSISSDLVGGTHRGRKYLGPLEDAAVQSDGRSLNSTLRSDINTAAAALLTPTASGSVLGVWSRKNSSFTLATGVSCSAIAGTQRRRMN